MSITAGAISLVSNSSNEAKLSATAATGGSGPYTYQWYYSTTTGFSPSGSNIISGATALTLDLTGLIPNTTYYFKVIATDTGHSNDTVTYTQLAVTTNGISPSQNQFAQTPTLGQVQMPYSYDTIACQVDVSESGTLYAGTPVSIVDNAGGLPKVIKCAASDDDCFGFVNFNPKNRSYIAGNVLEISQEGNVLYLYATGAIARGVQVELDIANNGVKQATAMSGNDIVGWAFDKAAAQGDLIRVRVLSPSFLKA